MKKVFDQTVRDLKREVNKKVLKVPGVEQKILDATSNEPWGPHGSNLADIAQATRNYHEYQIIMSVIWKRINDTGKNWRHVYKGLTVLEYLVAHGSERVIDEIKEHAYQISTLSDFQYIDSSGRDQGSNVRKKSQSLVALVNDKERIHEVRQKALANRDKYRSSFSTGGVNRPSSYSGTGGYGDRYDDDRYGSRDEDRNGYGRERDFRDDDRYGRNGDSYSRDGERYGRDSEERYGRESYRDDDYRGSRGNDGNDDYQFRSRNRSLDRDRNRSFDDDDRHSSRSGGARGDDPSYDERRLEQKLSEQSVGAPPSYEDAIRDTRNHVQDGRDRGTAGVPTPKPPSPPVTKSSSISESSTRAPGAAGPAMPTANKEVDSFDEFDPRGSASAIPPDASSAEMDLFGTLSAADSLNSLALVPVNSSSASSEAGMHNNSHSGANFVALSSASTVFSQTAEDPFGDSPFKATPVDNVPTQLQNVAPVTSFQGSTSSLSASATNGETISNFDFGDSFLTSAPSHMPNGQLPTATPAPLAPDFPPAQSHNNALGNLLPQGGPSITYSSHVTPLVAQASSQAVSSNFIGQSGLSAPLTSQVASSNPFVQSGPSQAAPTNTFIQSGSTSSVAFQVVPQGVPSAPQGVPPTPFSQSALSTSLDLQAAPPATVGQPAKAPQPKDKFETKSTVWADTLNRGLVNLNISGPKINPLADIGIDFDQINRMEKRKEKEKSAATPVSTINMGKAMGSGSGIGRAGAGCLARPPNPMMGSNVGMGMGMGMGGAGGMGMGMSMGGTGGTGMGMGTGIGGTGGMGMGMGGYGGGMNQPMGMGMGMNTSMAQGAPMQPVSGMPPRPGMPGVGYNPMMGMGGYGPQQPYGGYR